MAFSFTKFYQLKYKSINISYIKVKQKSLEPKMLLEYRLKSLDDSKWTWDLTFDIFVTSFNVIFIWPLKKGNLKCVSSVLHNIIDRICLNLTDKTMETKRLNNYINSN